MSEFQTIAYAQRSVLRTGLFASAPGHLPPKRSVLYGLYAEPEHNGVTGYHAVALLIIQETVQ
jgi:hypothetical protein